MIVGPSGSGKTTLLNMIGCIDVPDSGGVEIRGEDVLLLSDNALADFRARTIGYVFQSFNLIPVLSAFENVEYPLLLLNVPAAERRRRTLAVLEALWDFRRRRGNGRTNYPAARNSAWRSPGPLVKETGPRAGR